MRALSVPCAACFPPQRPDSKVPCLQPAAHRSRLREWGLFTYWVLVSQLVKMRFIFVPSFRKYLLKYKNEQADCLCSHGAYAIDRN